MNNKLEKCPHVDENGKSTIIKILMGRRICRRCREILCDPENIDRETVYDVKSSPVDISLINKSIGNIFNISTLCVEFSRHICPIIEGGTIDIDGIQKFIDDESKFLEVYKWKVMRDDDKLWKFISNNIVIPDYLYDLTGRRLYHHLIIENNNVSEYGKKYITENDIFYPYSYKLDEDFILNYLPEYIDVNDFFMINGGNYTTNCIRKFKDDINIWDNISYNHTFTEEELEEFKDYIDWEMYFICNYNKGVNLDKYVERCDFTKSLIEYSYNFLFDYLEEYSEIDFINKYKEYIDINKVLIECDELTRIKVNMGGEEEYYEFIKTIYPDINDKDKLIELTVNGDDYIVELLADNFENLDFVLDKDVDKINPLIVLKYIDKFNKDKLKEKYGNIDISSYEVEIY